MKILNKLYKIIYLDQNIKVNNYLNKTSHNQPRDVYFKKERATFFLKMKKMQVKFQIWKKKQYSWKRTVKISKGIARIFLSELSLTKVQKPEDESNFFENLNAKYEILAGHSR